MLFYYFMICVCGDDEDVKFGLLLKSEFILTKWACKMMIIFTYRL